MATAVATVMAVAGSPLSAPCQDVDGSFIVGRFLSKRLATARWKAAAVVAAWSHRKVVSSFTRKGDGESRLREFESGNGSLSAQLDCVDVEGQYSNVSDVVEELQPSDLLILTNGPGEVTTWVKPVVAALRRRFHKQGWTVRVSVVLAPCPHASGGELTLLRSFSEVDRCQGPEHFWQLLLLNRTAEGWDWHKQGVCIFLGGDQFTAFLVGKRLGYRTLVYAEDAVRWPGLMDMYAVSNPELLNSIPGWLRTRCKVVGDLFSDAVASTEAGDLSENESSAEEQYLITEQALMAERDVKVLGLLPGSKDIKLSIGVPYMMAVTNLLHERMGGRVRFLLPLAPTVTLQMLAKHGDRAHNPFIGRFGWSAGHVTSEKDGRIYLVTEGGVQIEIRQQYPSYEVYKQCCLCITTVGTNTAELGSLGIPMLVVLPTHALEVFKGATGGVLGLLANIPGWCGDQVTRMVNNAALHTAGYISWPNRWAGTEIVPEIIGMVEPAEVAQAAEKCLSGDHLMSMRKKLLSLKQQRLESAVEKLGSKGAADLISSEVEKLLLLSKS